jgi:hypothetical protein
MESGTLNIRINKTIASSPEIISKIEKHEY